MSIRRQNAHDGESPVMPWWVKDWLTSETVLGMPRAARSLYFDLLQYQWIHGSIPAEARVLAGMTGEGHAAFLKLWRYCGSCFDKGADGRLRNPRVEKERRADAEYRAKKAAAGLKGAANRWQGDGTAIGGATDSPGANGWPPSPSPSPSPQTPTGGGADKPPPVEAPPPKAKPARREPTTDHHALVRAWGDAWQAAYGRAYPYGEAEEFRHVRAVLKRAGSLAEAERVMHAMFASPPEWLEGKSLDLATFDRHFAKYVAVHQSSLDDQLARYPRI